MGVKLIFTSYPFTDEYFLDAIQEQDTLYEFLSLFNIPSTEENIRCKFPTQVEYDKIKQNIKSIELKNLLCKYLAKDIFVIPYKDDFSLPDKIYNVKIPDDET